MLKEQIEKDFIVSYKNREELKSSVLRLLKSAIKNAEIASGQSLADADTISVLKKEAKQRKESIEAYSKAGNLEAAQKEKSELSIIESYLPAELSKEKIEKIVEETIAELGVSDLSKFGQVIGAIMAKYRGQVDGNIVSAIVKDKLSHS